MFDTYRATLAAAVLACGLLLAGCGSPGTSPIAATSSAAASPSPTVAATAPAPGECSSFAQAYNGKVSPVLASPAPGGNADVYSTEMTDAFNALAATVSSATDPYSQTIAKDAAAVAAEPTSYTALGTFNTDLAAFLKACGMRAGS
jgi:hypothetical protein